MADLAWSLWQTHAPDAAKVALDAALERLAQQDPDPGLQWAAPAHRQGHAPLGLALLVLPPDWQRIAARRGSMHVTDTYVLHLDRDWVPAFHPPGAPLGATGYRWQLPHHILPVYSREHGVRLLGAWSLVLGQHLEFPAEADIAPLIGQQPLRGGWDIGRASASHTHWTPVGNAVLPDRFWTQEGVCQAAGNELPTLHPRYSAATAAVFPRVDPRDTRPLLPHLCDPARESTTFAASVGWRVSASPPYAERVTALAVHLTAPPDLSLLQRCPACWMAVAQTYETRQVAASRA